MGTKQAQYEEELTAGHYGVRMERGVMDLELLSVEYEVSDVLHAAVSPVDLADAPSHLLSLQTRLEALQVGTQHCSYPNTLTLNPKP